MFQAVARFLHLFSQHLLVNRHDQYVIEIELLAGVHQHANDVGQVVQLMLGEEIIMQIEGAKDDVDNEHVVLVAAIKRVVAH